MKNIETVLSGNKDIEDKFKKSWTKLSPDTKTTAIFEVDKLQQLGPDSGSQIEYIESYIETHALDIPGGKYKLLFAYDTKMRQIILFEFCDIGVNDYEQLYRYTCRHFSLLFPTREYMRKKP